MLTKPEMPTARWVLAAALAAGVFGGGSAIAQSKGAAGSKKLYCWNENGHKVCGDALPAEAADSARVEISPRSGLPTRQVARALTDDERTAAAMASEQVRRQAEAEAIGKRRDLAMVESYMTEADLLRAYGERTSLVEESVKTSEMSVVNLRQSLLGLLRQAGDLELLREPVPKPLAQKIQVQHDELVRQQLILADQRRDRATLKQELQEALQRYRSLKQAASDAAAGAMTATDPTAAPRTP